MQLSFPYTFTAGTTIIASQVNSNNTAVSNVVNGNLDQDNFTTLTGALTWAITNNVLAQSISSTSTQGIASLSASGVLASGKSILKVASAASQTTGDALIWLEYSSVSSTIPLAYLTNAGTGIGAQIVQSGVLAASKAALYISASAAQTTGVGAVYAELTNASSTIPLYAGKQSGTGDVINIKDGSGNNIFKVDSGGNITASGTFGNSEPRRNYLYNGNFDIWQRGTSTTISNGFGAYLADRWFAKNSLGTNGVLTYSRQTASSDGSLYAAQVQITAQPTAGQTNGCELYQTLENLDSLAFYNGTASFRFRIKGLNAVTQVGIQFLSATTETLVGTPIGVEQTFTVNSSTFTTCTASGISIGTAQTTSGVIGIRIRITGISAGNLFDLNNGFVVEQASVVLGDTAPGSFQRMHASVADELKACQRYYEKSYSAGVYPGDLSAVVASAHLCNGITGNDLEPGVRFIVTKRANPVIQFWSQVSGVANNVGDLTVTADMVGASSECSNTSGFRVFKTSGVTVGRFYAFQWTADADIL